MTGFLGDGTSYVYDFAGNLTQMTDSKGAIYSFGYDYLNRKTSATYPPDSGGVVRNELWVYDSAGNLVQYTNPGGVIDKFTYDNRNRQLESKWPAGQGPDITTAYDAGSRVTSISTADGTTVGFGYDNANRQISEDQTLTGQPSRHIDMPVDVDGNRASLSLNGSAYTFYYDYTQRQQLAHIRNSPTLGSGLWFGYTYDLDGDLTKRQDLVQGLDSTLFSYDVLDRVTLCTQTGANDVAFAWSHYDYDLNNNIQDTYRDEQAGKGERFGYDDANQLSSAVYNADNVQTPNPTNYDRSVSYTCDALNRMSMNDNGTLTNYTPNGLNQLTAVTGMQSTYDNNFNQKKLGGWIYAYDAARRVTAANNNSTGQSVFFFYDGLNRCVKRMTDGVTKHITYDGWKPIEEWDASGDFVAWNLYGPGPDEILMRWEPTVSYYLQSHYHADQFGNVKFLLDGFNAVLEKYTYDAFGTPKITDASGNVLAESAWDNRFMFTGREYLSTIGIYDYRNRMYSPLIGRFLQTDPLGFDAGDDNLFRYVANNPVNMIDPMGTDAVPIPGGYRYIPRPGLDLNRLSGHWIANPNPDYDRQCATAQQFVCGGFINGVLHDVPRAQFWSPGPPPYASTPHGTLVATGFQDGHYPNLDPQTYTQTYPGSPINHTGLWEGYDASGNKLVYDQSTGKPLGTEVAPDQRDWHIVEVSKDHGPYDRQPSNSGVTAAAFYGALNFWKAAFPGSLLGSFAPGSPYDPNAPLGPSAPGGQRGFDGAALSFAYQQQSINP